MDLLDHAGVRCGGVGQAEGHSLELVLPKRRRERGFRAVLFSDGHLMESTRAVHGGEYRTLGEMVEVVLDIWKRECVFDGDFIQPPIIDAPTYFTVLFGDRSGLEGPRRVGGLDDVIPDPVVHLLLEVPYHNRVEWAVPRFDGRVVFGMN